MNALLIVTSPGVCADGPRVLLVPMCRNGHLDPKRSPSSGNCLLCAKAIKDRDRDKVNERARIRYRRQHPPKSPPERCRSGKHLYAEVGRYANGSCRQCTLERHWAKKPIKAVRHGLCTYCNWSRHDISIHADGGFCRNGHPSAVVGRDKHGRCRGCQREADKRRRERLRFDGPRRAKDSRVETIVPSATGVPFRVKPGEGFVMGEAR